MTQDIRINSEFYGHPKTVRFFGRTGDHGIVCLIRLWIFVSRYFPRGILSGMTPAEIADAAGWKGDPQEFVAALLEAGGPGRAGFLDVVDTDGIRGYAIHDWQAHNPFAYFKEERSEIARINIQKRWSKKRKSLKKQGPNKEGNDGRIPSVFNQNTPSPSPTPPPKGREEGDPALPLPVSGTGADRVQGEGEVDDPEVRAATLRFIKNAGRKIGGVDPNNGSGKEKAEDGTDFLASLPKPKYEALKVAIEKFNAKVWTKDQVEQHLAEAAFEEAEFLLTDYLFASPEVAS